MRGTFMQKNSLKQKEKKSLAQNFKDFFSFNKGDRKSKIISIIAIMVFLIAVSLLILLFMKYYRTAQTTKKYQQLYQTTSPSGLDKKDEQTGMLPSFDKLYAINDDVVGYIKINDTKLSYPVVKGDDNTFYLNKTLYKEYEPFGIPFVDYRAMILPEYQSTNLTIYGHSAMDGSFFAAVKKYKDIEFYKQHPTITFNTIYGNGEYKIIGLFMEDVNPEHGGFFNYHDFVDAIDSAEFNEYIENVKVRSYFNTTVDVNDTDHLITLSTCDTEINKTDFRIVLVARKVRDGESSEVNVDDATINKTQLMPPLWVEKKGKQNIYN